MAKYQVITPGKNKESIDILYGYHSTIFRKALIGVIALFTIIRTDRNMLLACYSHKHISYRIRTIIRKAIMISSINKQLVMDSLLMAVNKRKPAKNLLLHSDQGSQYTSQGYQYLLSIKNIDEL